MPNNIKFIWTDAHITRSIVQSRSENIYLFGDNVEHWGMGGMAKEMRGEPNAVGIPTKWTAHMYDAAFFSDKRGEFLTEEDHIITAIEESELLACQPNRSGNIIVPMNIGKGLAQMPTRCPKLYKRMCELLGKES